MRNILYRFRFLAACGSFFLFLFFLAPCRSRGQVVSTKIILSGTFPGKAVVMPPRENLPEEEGNVVPYPADAVKDGVEGRVKLQMLIAADGSIRESEVIENGGDNRLLRASVEGFRKAGFAPGSVDGVPTEMRIIAEVRFSVEKEDRSLMEKW